jgi:uncharacterized Zn finger protein (UPF0148 family)
MQGGEDSIVCPVSAENVEIANDLDSKIEKAEKSERDARMTKFETQNRLRQNENAISRIKALMRRAQSAQDKESLKKELEEAMKSLEYEKRMLMLNEENVVETGISLNYLIASRKRE